MNLIDKPVRRTSASMMQRATVCIWSDSLEEKVEFTTWLNTWRKVMTFVSHDYGCDCCIHLFDLEGPKEAIDALPAELLTASEWTEHGTKPPPRTLLLQPEKAGACGHVATAEI